MHVTAESDAGAKPALGEPTIDQPAVVAGGGGTVVDRPLMLTGGVAARLNMPRRTPNKLSADAATPRGDTKRD